MNDRASPIITGGLQQQTPGDDVAATWLPLSDAQRAVWLDLRLGADPRAYVVAARVRFDGALDADVAQQALSLLMARHDALRLLVCAEQPRQRLLHASPAPMTLQDGAAVTGASSTTALTDDDVDRWVAQRLAMPLQPGTGLLFAVDLLRVRPGRLEVLWRCHHLMADTAGLALAMRRWLETCELLASDVPSDLPAGSSFTHTLAAGAGYTASPQAAADLQHWMQRFETLPQPLFGTGRAVAPDSPQPTPLRWALEGAAYSSWRAVCKKSGITEQRALAALLALALGTRYGRHDLCLGLALHRRDLQTMGVVGMFAAALPVRAQWLPEDTLTQAVLRMANALDADYRHQRAPMDTIGRALNLGASGHSRLFDASLSFTQLEGTAGLQVSGHRVTPQSLVPAAIVPLPFLVTDQPDRQRLEFVLGWNPAHLSRVEAESVADALRRTIQAYCREPRLPVAELETVSSDEQAQLLQHASRTAMPVPQGALHDHVRAQVLRHAEAVAVVDGAHQLSYAELDARSTVLAGQLRAALGGAVEPVVGVALPRSADTVVALLAILKAGAVYLPLDTAYPLQRLQFMLDDAGAALLIDTPDTAALSAPRLAADVGTAALPLVADPEQLAYVIYTSGSTGQPKAVGVPHRAAVNLAYARHGHDPIGPGDRVLAAISVGFDVSIGQLLLPLLSGATIVIAPPLKDLQAEAFWALLQQHGVTHINSVPSFFDTVSEALVALPQAQRYRGLKRLMLGGEVLTGALARKLQQRLPGTQIVNMYGPTEACIDATAYVVPEAGSAADALPATLPIGQPLPNYRAYVLDTLGRLCPIGVAGELCLAGAGLARGYLRNPGATASKFVADPYGQPGERMYRTGDLARWREDGQIEFLGRNDEQVKIRGFRVETGEIEAALLAQPGLQQAAVVAVKDAQGQARLVAYLVAAAIASEPTTTTTTAKTTAATDTATTRASEAALRTALARQLPEHMLPQAWVWLPALPITTNGKLDRKALPLPELGTAVRHDFDAPQGATESAIAAIWQDLLKVQQVGRNDNFFDLGGHSLRAIAMVERLRQAGWQVDVPTVFLQPTVVALAAACTPVAAHSDAGQAPPPPAVPLGATHITPDMLPLVQLSQTDIDHIVDQVPGGAAAVQDIYPLAPLQQGMLYHHLMQQQGDVFLTPFVLGFAQRAGLDHFMAALRQVVARHDILRTAIVWQGLAEPVQVVWRDATLPLEEVATETAGHVAVPATAAPSAIEALQARVDPRHHRINLGHAPLLRAVAMHDPAGAPGGRWLLALVLHHLALDHASMDTVMQEVAAIMAGQAQQLPAPVPFRNLVWHTVSTPQRAAREAAHSAFFTQMLADVDTPTTPFGLATLPGEDDKLTEARLVLPAALAAEARQAARSQGVNLASLMHLAWALVLARCSGREDVVFGTVLTGRMDAGAANQRALGMLINTLPVRVRMGHHRVRDVLQDTQALLAELLRHEHAALALAQRCSGVAAPAPLFTALFNYRHAPAATSSQGAAAANGLHNIAPGVDLLWGQERTGYPLALAVDDDGTGLTLQVQALAPAQPLRVAQWVVAAVSSIVHAASSPCHALDLVPAAERGLQLLAFNPPAWALPRQPLHQLVSEQAQRTPHALAVVGGDLTCTYAEIDASSELLARRIRAAVKKHLEPVVGVALPRSADTVVALLAILKAGAVYLPLDTAYPLQRLQFMLDDAGAALLIDTPDTAALSAPRLAADVGTAALPLVTDPEQLAYVIYTSGSTGQPKAVGVPHRAAVNLAYARHGHDPIGPGDRVLAAISVGFDVSIGQLLLPLLSGATVVIAPPLKDLQAEAFWALLQQHGVTHINSVPSFFDTVSEALVALPQAQRYRGLKRLMLGGEVLTGALARKLQQRLPGTQIVNMYGPTEACIDATAYVVPEPGASELPATLPTTLPIGQPLPNYRAYVLDTLGRLCPIGVTGELCLAGAGLARGYLRNPGATASKFVADPYGQPGERMYRTGDLARWREDGQIEFLGRNDEQVKIRGFRVETGEIEAALLAQPGLQQAAVVAVKDAQSQARLVAYLVAAAIASEATTTTTTATTTAATDTATTRASEAALRTALARQLPEHMLPQAWVWLHALPITTNGKLDRKALPLPEADAASPRNIVAPRDALETALQQAWQQTLNTPHAIGIDDDFFALGGQSLLAIKLVHACVAAARQHGVADAAERLQLRQLMAGPTIAAMAQRLRGGAPRPGGPATAEAMRDDLLVPLRASGTRRPLFCVHPQSGSVWCFADLARAVHPDVPVWGVQARGLQAGEVPHRTVDAMAQDYVRAVRSVQPQGPYRLLGYSSGGVAAHAMACLLQEAGESVELLALLDSPLPAAPGSDGEATDGNSTAGTPITAVEDSDVLADAGRLFGITDPAQWPRNAEELRTAMLQRQLADTSFSEDDAARLISTARSIVQATRQHQPARMALPLVQLRALQRNTPAADWSSTLPCGQAVTYDLQADHVTLVGPALAPLLAHLLLPHLG